MSTIKKVVLPVAGLGARVMPLTLHQPKGMIGIVDRPVVHYVIDEILAAGIKEIILIVSPRQRHFKEYFSYLLRKDPSWKKIAFRVITQKKPLGNGDAVLLAKKFVGEVPFAVCFGDDLLSDTVPPLKMLINFFRKTRSPVLMLEPVPRKIVSRYGVVKVKKTKIAKDLYQITDIVEKPSVEKAPSNLTIIGRYILTPDIFEEIQKLYPRTKPGREIYLADALKNYLRAGGRIYGWHFRGNRFDCGSKMGILKAQVHFGLRHPEFKKEFKQYLKQLSQRPL